MTDDNCSELEKDTNKKLQKTINGMLNDLYDKYFNTNILDFFPTTKITEEKPK